MEIRRGDSSKYRFLKTITQFTSPDTTLEGGDILYVSGDFDEVRKFAGQYSMDILDEHRTEEAAAKDAHGNSSLDFYEIGIAEIIIVPTSGLINKSIKDIDLRGKFNINVLGIRRRNEYLLHDLGEVKVHGGDVMLVQ